MNASLLICEMFAWYKSQRKSLVDVLEELYQEYGCYESKLLSFQFEGADGFAKMQSLMTELRTNRPAELAGIAVECSIDYLNDDTGLPKSNVLRFFLKNGAEAVVRPSGTEPKLKVYLTVIGRNKVEAKKEIELLVESMERFLMS